MAVTFAAGRLRVGATVVAVMRELVPVLKLRAVEFTEPDHDLDFLKLLRSVVNSPSVGVIDDRDDVRQLGRRANKGGAIKDFAVVGRAQASVATCDAAVLALEHAVKRGKIRLKDLPQLVVPPTADMDLDTIARTIAGRVTGLGTKEYGVGHLVRTLVDAAMIVFNDGGGERTAGVTRVFPALPSVLKKDSGAFGKIPIMSPESLPNVLRHGAKVGDENGTANLHLDLDEIIGLFPRWEQANARQAIRHFKGWDLRARLCGNLALSEPDLRAYDAHCALGGYEVKKDVMEFRKKLKNMLTNEENGLLETPAEKRQRQKGRKPAKRCLLTAESRIRGCVVSPEMARMVYLQLAPPPPVPELYDALMCVSEVLGVPPPHDEARAMRTLVHAVDAQHTAGFRVQLRGRKKCPDAVAGLRKINGWADGVLLVRTEKPAAFVVYDSFDQRRGLFGGGDGGEFVEAACCSPSGDRRPRKRHRSH